MTMCMACGVILERVSLIAAEEYIALPSARECGPTTGRRTGSRVLIGEASAHTAVLSLGDRACTLRARLREMVRRVADLVRLPPQIVPRLEALASAALAANSKSRYGEAAIGVTIGALACALARQEGLPLLIAEVAHACGCRAITIGRRMARLARTPGGAPSDTGSDTGSDDGCDADVDARAPAVRAPAKSPGGALASPAMRAAAPSSDVCGDTAPAPRRPVGTLRVPSVDPASLVAQTAQRLAAAGACSPAHARDWHGICERARTLLLIGRASSLVEGRHPLHLAAAAVLVSASEAAAAPTAERAAAALAIGANALRARIRELVGAALRLVAVLHASAAHSSAALADAAPARGFRAADPRAARGARGRKRARDVGYFSMAAAAALPPGCATPFSFAFVCEHAPLLLRALAQNTPAVRAAGTGAARSSGPGAEPATVELAIAPPPAFLAASVQRDKCDSRVHAAQARLALAATSAGTAAADCGNAGPCAREGDASVARCARHERAAPARLDAVDVAVERLLLAGVPPEALILISAKGRRGARDGAALIYAAAAADAAAQREHGARVAPHVERAEREELSEAEDDDEVRAALRSVREVEGLRPLHLALHGEVPTPRVGGLD